MKSFISTETDDIYKNNILKVVEIKTIQTSLVINEGNNGGPVFNKKGKLIGIISFRLKDRNEDVIQGVSFALASSSIKVFI